MQCNCNQSTNRWPGTPPRPTWPPFVSVAGRLVAGVSLRLGVWGEGRLHFGHTAGIGCVSGRGVSSGVVGGGGIGRRVGGVEIWWRLCVGWDGNFIDATAETTQGKIGQDSLQNEIKMSSLLQTFYSISINHFTTLLRMFQSVLYCFRLMDVFFSPSNWTGFTSYHGKNKLDRHLKLFRGGIHNDI